MAGYRLFQEIIAISKSSEWDKARSEWKLRDIYEVDEPETCLCGHYPIVEICIIENAFNRNVATVGNCCVKKFLGLPSDKIFQAVKRVRKDPKKSLNAECIDHAYSKGWITDWELKFYRNVMKKRILTANQSEKKAQINTLMLGRMKRMRNGNK